tara:strand:- start:925 stop:1290 length:366 start_codon:yes stop_codon:yes gene_type:complete
MSKNNLISIIFFILMLSFVGWKFYVSSNAKKEISRLKEEGDFQLVDVRTPAEFNDASVKDSLNIPLANLEDSLHLLDKTKPVIIFCASGMRSARGKSILEGSGFVKVINGGSYTNVESALK